MAQASTNYYDLLGVLINSTEKEVKQNLSEVAFHISKIIYYLLTLFVNIISISIYLSIYLYMLIYIAFRGSKP